MGCLCSKESSEKDAVDVREKELNNSSVLLVPPALSTAELGGAGKGSVRQMPRTSSHGFVYAKFNDKSSNLIVGNPTKVHHERCITLDAGIGEGQPLMSRILSMPHSTEGELIAAGWPSWLTSAAGDAIKGWVPRQFDSFRKLNQIGQGSYSSVYKARDLKTGKIVALKKVRFSNTDAESVRFMAREICILRRLDHPNVMKLEGLITSNMSSSLYLVFEYMEHDLAGLEAIPGIKFTEPQIKCFMHQMLCGLEHCHSRGVLHRDIKGSNLLVGENGILKIGDFGLAALYEPEKKQPLTSRVVTLWYRAPELLLGSTEYGASIDLWSAGCILAELFAGKHIMPGRTEVEQMHKIFKLCGSPSEDYWQRTKFPYATSFKPQCHYKRRVAETFKDFPSSALALVDKLLAIEPEDRGSATSALKSEFFTTNPLPCDPSSLPKFPPSKEFDSKLRDEEARRKKAEDIKGRGPVSVSRCARDTKVTQTPEFNAQGDISVPEQGKANPNMFIHKYNRHEDGGPVFKIEPNSVYVQNGYSHSTSFAQTAGPSLEKRSDYLKKNLELRTEGSHVNQAVADTISALQKDKGREPRLGYVPKKSRMHYSGPLVPLGGTIDDMLREHETLMQQAFRSVKIKTKPGQ